MPVGLGGHLSGVDKYGHSPKGSRQINLSSPSPGLGVAQLCNSLVTKDSVGVMCLIMQRAVVEVRKEGMPNLMGRLSYMVPQGRIETLPIPWYRVEPEPPGLPIKPGRARNLSLSNAKVNNQEMVADDLESSMGTQAGKEASFPGFIGACPVASGKSPFGQKRM